MVPTHTRTRVLTLVLATAAALPLLLVVSPAVAEHRPGYSGGSAPAWAPAGEATIHPGVQTRSPSGQCTSNFIFINGDDVLIGQAAHCTGNSAATSTNGCEQDPAPLPIGTQVRIQGASQPGTLVYSSWNAMLEAGEGEDATCAYNDFALIQIDPADVANVNPSLPAWGGPNGIGTSAVGQQVYAYGNSSLRLGITELSPKTGVTVGVDPSGWSYDVYTVTPGIPGDSGSAVLNAAGAGLGVLVTVQLAPLVGSNGITDLGKAVGYARSHGMPGLELVNGTEAFDGSLLNLLPQLTEATEPPTATTEAPAETTEPPATEPPATEPPATEPPATEPPTTAVETTEEPATTEPVATVAPSTEPPATSPTTAP